MQVEVLLHLDDLLVTEPDPTVGELLAALRPTWSTKQRAGLANALYALERAGLAERDPNAEVPSWWLTNAGYARAQHERPRRR